MTSTPRRAQASGQRERPARDGIRDSAWPMLHYVLYLYVQLYHGNYLAGSISLTD